MRFCFDLDETLCDSSSGYYSATPIPKMVELTQELKRQGHTIIIYTARKMATYNGNVAKAIASIGELTLQQLEAWRIPYDEIYFGKPCADYYIDDKAVETSSFEHVKERIKQCSQ